MPNVKLKSLWALALLMMLLLAAVPRPAAGGAAQDCFLSDEMAAPAGDVTEDSDLTQAPGSAASGGTAAMVAAPIAAESDAEETSHAPAVGTHGPRTPWPDMVPLDG